MSYSSKRQVKTAERASKNSPIKIVLSPLLIVYDILKYLLLSIFFGIIIEWSGMGLGYFSSEHAQSVLQIEFAYLGNNFSTTIFGMSAEDAALIVISTLNSYLSVTTSVTGEMISQKSIAMFGNSVTPYINSAIYVIMTIGIRCVIIMLSMALFLIVAIAAAVDGLHERELRKVGGDDEHGDVYHWAKAWVPRIFVLSPVIYLAWPDQINPNYILLPGMILFFVAVYLMFSKYKKVL